MFRIIQTFLSIYLLASSQVYASLEVSSIDNTIQLNNKVYDLNNLDRFRVSVPESRYIFEGQHERFPTTSVFFKEYENEILLVSYDIHDQVDKLSVVGKDTGIVVGSLESIGNGILFDALMDKEVENDILVSNRADTEGIRRLRGSSSQDTQVKQECAEYENVELSIRFDASYCEAKGGEFGAVSEILYLMALASLKYEYNGECSKVIVSSLDGYCDERSVSSDWEDLLRVENGLSIQRI